mgnify:CR=1 FL=1
MSGTYRAQDLSFGAWSLWFSRWDYNNNVWLPLERGGFVRGDFVPETTMENVRFEVGIPKVPAAIAYTAVANRARFTIAEINIDLLRRILNNQNIGIINGSNISRTETFTDETEFFSNFVVNTDFFPATKRFYKLRYQPATNVLLQYYDGSSWVNIPSTDYNIETLVGVTYITTTHTSTSSTSVPDSAPIRITYDEVVLDQKYMELYSNPERLGQVYRILAIQKSILDPNRWNFVYFYKAQIESITFSGFRGDDFGNIELTFVALPDYPQGTPEVFASAGLATVRLGEIRYTPSGNPAQDEVLIVGQFEEE